MCCRSRGGGLSLRQLCELGLKIASPLAYLHQMGVVHYDLKPDNILVDVHINRGATTPDVKLADFGLAEWRQHGLGVQGMR